MNTHQVKGFNMAKVKMLQTVPGSLDGKSVQSYMKGEEYDIPEDNPLYDVFISPSNHFAEKVLPPAPVTVEPVKEAAIKPEPTVKPKAKPAAPKNKALKRAPVNKGKAKKK